MILPFGTPPRPSAISRLKEPVGMVSTFMFAAESPSFMTAPFPYCFSIGIECTQFIFVIISHTEYSPYYANVRSLLYTYYYKSALLSTVFLVSFFSPQILCTGAASNISLCTSVAYSTLLPQPKNTAKKIPKRLFFPLLPFRDFFLIFQNADQLIRSASCTFPRTVLRNLPKRNPVPLHGRSSCSTRVFCRNRCALRTARYPSSHAHCSL